MESIEGTFQENNRAFEKSYYKREWLHRTGTITAVFLVLISAIVVVCSALTLTLTGVNPLMDVILPGILPGCVGLFISAPLIYFSTLRTLEKKEIRLKWLDSIKAFFDEHPDKLTPKKEAGDFIIKHVLLVPDHITKPSYWEPSPDRWLPRLPHLMKIRHKQLLSDLKDYYPKPDEGEDPNPAREAIDSATAEVMGKKPKKKKKAESKEEARAHTPAI